MQIQVRPAFPRRAGADAQRGLVAFWQPTRPGGLAQPRGGRRAGRRRRGAGPRRSRQPHRLRRGRQGASAKPSRGTPPSQLLFQMFTAANHRRLRRRTGRRSGKGKMATTLTICLFRNNEVTIGHVGDCRVYLIQQGRIRRVTNDHSYAGVQLKLGLITVEEADEQRRCGRVLTRSVGQDPIVRVDYHTRHRQPRRLRRPMLRRALIASSPRGRSSTSSPSCPPERGVPRAGRAGRAARGRRQPVRCRSSRSTDVERLSYYRGLPIYQKVTGYPWEMNSKSASCSTTAIRSPTSSARSGMATIYKATDVNDRTRRGAEGAVHAVRDAIPASTAASSANRRSARRSNHPYILRIDADDETHKSRPYIVMEYLEGQTLGHLMRSVRPMPQSPTP